MELRLVLAVRKIMGDFSCCKAAFLEKTMLVTSLCNLEKKEFVSV